DEDRLSGDQAGGSGRVDRRYASDVAAARRRRQQGARIMTKMAKDKGLVLVVDSDLSRATGVHNACVEAGCRTVVARDLPTALLMISQHLFSAAVFSSRVSEEGDGWSLAAVFRLIFPKAYVAVIARERSVTSLQ